MALLNDRGRQSGFMEAQWTAVPPFPLEGCLDACDVLPTRGLETVNKVFIHIQFIHLKDSIYNYKINETSFAFISMGCTIHMNKF